MPARSDDAELGVILHAAGPLLSWLKRKQILLFVTFVGAVVAVIGPILFPEIEWWTWLRVVAGVAAALAIVADKMADRFDTVVAASKFRESEKLAEKAIDDVNVVLSEAIEVLFLSGVARNEAARALRRTIARQAASAVGDGSRATYYTMSRESNSGSRILGEPEHGAIGRHDKPERPFIEREDPQNTIWTLMDRADDEPAIYNAPDYVYGIDWKKKGYDTFYSVPVKAKHIQLGFLSVNNVDAGAIGGPQQAAVLAMARTMALLVAACRGSQWLNAQESRHLDV